MIAPYYKPEDGNLSSMASSYIHKIKEIKTGGVHIETAGFNHVSKLALAIASHAYTLHCVQDWHKNSVTTNELKLI